MMAKDPNEGFDFFFFLEWWHSKCCWNLSRGGCFFCWCFGMEVVVGSGSDKQSIICEDPNNMILIGVARRQGKSIDDGFEGVIKDKGNLVKVPTIVKYTSLISMVHIPFLNTSTVVPAWLNIVLSHGNNYSSFIGSIRVMVLTDKNFIPYTIRILISSPWLERRAPFLISLFWRPSPPSLFLEVTMSHLTICIFLL